MPKIISQWPIISGLGASNALSNVYDFGNLVALYWCDMPKFRVLDGFLKEFRTSENRIQQKINLEINAYFSMIIFPLEIYQARTSFEEGDLNILRYSEENIGLGSRRSTIVLQKIQIQ